jgi:putative transposase
MSRRGDCWENAVAESFFASLKLELVYQVQWPTRAAARTAIFEYLELFYNRRRRHSSLGYRSPPNLNDVTISGWQLNPGVHQLGASSTYTRQT